MTSRQRRLQIEAIIANGLQWIDQLRSLIEPDEDEIDRDHYTEHGNPVGELVPIPHDDHLLDLWASDVSDSQCVFPNAATLRTIGEQQTRPLCPMAVEVTDEPMPVEA